MNRFLANLFGSKSSTPSATRLGVETLGERLAPSATPTMYVVGNTLYVRGTDQNDRITIGASGSSLTVECDYEWGTTSRVFSASSGITRIDVRGEDGDDRITNNTVRPSVLDGGAGIDRIEGGGGSDVIDGESGSDTIYGRGGHDTIYGRFGYDWIDGGSGNDRIDGGEGDDRIYGGSGDDNISGGTGSELLYGGSGDDTLRGDEGFDRLYGEDGDDVIYLCYTVALPNGQTLMIDDGDLCDLKGGDGYDTIVFSWFTANG